MAILPEDRNIIKDSVSARFVPQTRLSSLTEVKINQFNYWRNLMDPIAKIDTSIPPEEGFTLDFRGYNLNSILIADVTSDPFSFVRSDTHIRNGLSDYWHILLTCSGCLVSESSGTILRSPAGSLQVTSMSVPFTGRFNRTRGLFIFLRRDLFASQSLALDAAHHTHLNGTIAELLKSFLRSLGSYLPTLEIEEVPAVEKSLLALLNATFRPTEGTIAEADETLSATRLGVAKAFIKSNLRTPDLGIGMLCRELGISRRKLYYLFEPDGGVASYIRRQRLIACRDAIRNTTEHKFISTIAYSYGFTDYSRFGKHFLAEFGYRPSEAKSAQDHAQVPDSAGAQNLADWLTRGPTR
ncbi:MAG: helix-turn-helix domain-containing protein [Rhodobacteraceae bacterium]|nr:helix-turn-helix domain-containing protein [Paracoccaceae bacterium]